MFKALVLALLAVSALADPILLHVSRRSSAGNYKNLLTAIQKNSPYIIGGTTAKAGDDPHQCSLRYSSHSCGASIISDQWLVTAAHCIDGSTPSQISIRCGTLRHASGGVDFKVAELIPHENYDSWELDNDIGLIKVSTKIPIGSTNLINIIALPTQDEVIPDTATVTVTGWGATREGGALPAELMTVDVPIVPNDKCNSQYESVGGTITPGMFCAGLDEGGKDACQGDSGGPVKLGGKLIGAVSWGYGCARPNYAGVYARVARYRDWIKTNSGI